MKNFKFIFSSNISFGPGERFKLDDLLQKENWKSVCIIIDKALIKLPIIEEMLGNINLNNMVLIKCDISEPTYEKLEEKRISSEKEEIDLFIGVGGGSTLDMAKALSVLYNNRGSAISYRGFDKFKEPIKPIIAIPTTAGTGSEITPNASFIDSIEKRKMGINGEAIRPKYAILDPELTLSCPKVPTISAGVDSMVHATEAFVAKKSNPMARMFAKVGFKLVFENLPLLVDDLENIELREKLMYGAFLSAIALMNSGTGPAAAMSYPLGVHYGVPHGIGGGIFLPHVIQHNINAGCFDYADLYFPEKSSGTKEEMAMLFIKNMWIVWEKLGVPREISSFGVSIKSTESLIKDTMDLKPALDQNPVPFYEKEISATLDNMIPE